METLNVTEKMSYLEFQDLYLKPHYYSHYQDNTIGILNIDFQTIKAGTPIKAECDKYSYVRVITYQPSNNPTHEQINIWSEECFKWPMPKYPINRIKADRVRMSIKEFKVKHLSKCHERDGYYYGILKGDFHIKGLHKIKVTVDEFDYIKYVEYEEYLANENWEANGYPWEDKNDSDTVEPNPY